MDRGPLALFGAIVAVGLGPALWLGAQFGNVTIAPVQPPAVVGEQRVDTGKAPGGAGAAPEEPAAIEPTRRTGYVPLSSTPSARPSATAEPEATEPDADPTTGPTGDTTEPTPTGGPSTPPTEDTTAPTDPPTSGDGDGEEPGDEVPAPDDTAGGATGVQLASR
jgi:hypothetical protein